MKKTNYLYILLLFCLICCKKEDHLPPSNFIVNIVSREETTMVIEWQNSSNNKNVTYAIEINNNIIVSNLTSKSYKITGLSSSIKYKGKVIATSKGLTTSSEFHAYPFYDQILASFNEDGLFCYNSPNLTAWKLTNTINSSPAISNDTVFVSGHQKLYATNLSSGHILWSQTMDIQYGRAGMFHYRDMLIFSNDSNTKIFAVNVKDGSIIWSGNEAADGLAISNGVLFFTTATEVIKAIDIKTGATKWVKPISNMSSGVSAKDGNVYIIGGNNLIVLDAQNGTEKWTYAFSGQSTFGIWGAPIAFGSVVYFPHGSPFTGQYYVSAVDVAQKSLIWKTKLDTYNYTAGLSVDESGLFISCYKEIFKLDRTLGNIVWKQTGNFTTALTVTGDNIYTNAEPLVNLITSYSKTTGKKTYTYDGAKWTYNPPVVVSKGKVYYPCSSGMSIID